MIQHNVRNLLKTTQFQQKNSVLVKVGIFQ